MRWASADRPVTSGDGSGLSDGSAAQVARGRVVFLRVFVGDEAALRLRARPERTRCRPPRQHRPRALQARRLGR